MDFYVSLQIAVELGTAFFAIICAFFTYISRKEDSIDHKYIMYFLLLSIAILISDSCGYYFNGNQTKAGYILIRLANYAIYTVYPLMVIAVAHYMSALIIKHGYKQNVLQLHLCQFLCTAHILTILASQYWGFLYYFDENNVYHRGFGYPISSIFGVFELICLMVMAISNWRHLSKFELVSLISYFSIPFVTNIIQLFHYGISLTELASSLCMILFFMFHEVEKSNRLHIQNQMLVAHKKLIAEKENKLSQQEQALKKQQKLLKEQQQVLSKREEALTLANSISEFYKSQLSAKEQQLAEAHVRISISQMQPHFIFNALGSIEQLCHTNPEMAAEATHKFTHYLRNNLLALSCCELKDFSEELAHIGAYVWLEKMRFDEDLNYEEEILCKHFRVPVLSVQPLVENAIKHGMSNSEDDILYVKLKSWEEADSYKIQVTDNGGGFDPDELPKDSRLHVGLINVRERLHHMCNAELIIESTIGQGSSFTISIPKDQYDIE